MLATVFLFLPLYVSGASPGDGNLTLQNERIAAFGSSWICGGWLGDIVDRDVETFVLPSTGVVGALGDCPSFNNTKFGIIVTDFGSYDFWPLERPWEDIEGGLRELIRCLKSTGAVVVYNQLFPDAAEYDIGQLCREEGVIHVTNLTEGIGVPLELNPMFLEDDPVHPNGEGYGIMAERTARVLLDVGLVESARTCEDLSSSIPSIFSRARDLIDSVEAIGAFVDIYRDHYVRAGYVRDMGFCHTANLSLHRRIIGPLESFMNVWAGVGNLGTYFSERFESANSSIEEVAAMGLDREAMLMDVDYSRAEKAWMEHDYDTAELYLDKVQARFEEIPEIFPTLVLSLLTILGLRGSAQGNKQWMMLRMRGPNPTRT